MGGDGDNFSGCGVADFFGGAVGAAENAEVVESDRIGTAERVGQGVRQNVEEAGGGSLGKIECLGENPREGALVHFWRGWAARRRRF